MSLTLIWTALRSFGLKWGGALLGPVLGAVPRWVIYAVVTLLAIAIVFGAGYYYGHSNASADCARQQSALQSKGTARADAAAEVGQQIATSTQRALSANDAYFSGLRAEALHADQNKSLGAFKTIAPGAAHIQTSLHATGVATDSAAAAIPLARAAEPECGLDADSLRIWNAGNDGPPAAGGGESDATLSGIAARLGWTAGNATGQPSGSGPALSPVPHFASGPQ